MERPIDISGASGMHSNVGSWNLEDVVLQRCKASGGWAGGNGLRRASASLRSARAREVCVTPKVLVGDAGQVVATGRGLFTRIEPASGSRLTGSRSAVGACLGGVSRDASGAVGAGANVSGRRAEGLAAERAEDRSRVEHGSGDADSPRACTGGPAPRFGGTIDHLDLLSQWNSRRLFTSLSDMKMTTTTERTPSVEDTEAPPNPGRIMELGLAFWGSKTLLSAVELGLFTELASGPCAGDELAARLALHPRSARDFLDALVALGMLERDGDTYANMADSNLFLDRDKPAYIGGILEMANARLYPFWASLTDALKTGEPQNEARTGGDFFATLYADPQRLAQFLHAMTGLSAGAATAIATTFPFQRYQSVADVGCAEGDLLVQLLHTHPHLRGVGFDLPPVRDTFERYVRSSGLEQRLVFTAGDFFSDPLPSADVITLGHILHDWGLEEKKQLLDKAYHALPPGGAVIVFESIIDDERRQNAFGLLMSLNMLIETSRGFDYTGADCREWMHDVGFTETYVQHLAGPDSMVVGIK
jgi:hypothetical protein